MMLRVAKTRTASVGVDQSPCALYSPSPFLPLPDRESCLPAPTIRVGAVLPPLLPPTMSETSSVFSSASAIPSTAAAVEADECGVVAVADTHMHLRIAAIFVILVGATGGALFPVLAKRSRWLRVPTSMFKCVHTIEAEKIMLTFPLFSSIASPTYPTILILVYIVADASPIFPSSTILSSPLLPGNPASPIRSFAKYFGSGVIVRLIVLISPGTCANTPSCR